MRILIAEDSATSRVLLRRTLESWGHEVLGTEDGQQAWDALQAEDRPTLAILDWMMPNMDGIEVCRRVRAHPDLKHLYIILLTSRDEATDIAEGLNAGADDYVAKPFERSVLEARIGGGIRVLELQSTLAQRVRELEASMAREKQLQGLLPICSYCKKIRDDQNYWQQVEGYIAQHADVEFSHGICPDCFDTVLKPDLEKAWADSQQDSPSDA